jgi:hypothetical protein
VFTDLRHTITIAFTRKVAKEGSKTSRTHNEAIQSATVNNTMIGTHKNITSEVARKENIRNVKSRRRG